MSAVTKPEASATQSENAVAAQTQPVFISSENDEARAVIVSLEFFERAVRALEDQADIRDAARARESNEPPLSFEELMSEFRD
ncbi:prevent-host-death family protein [Leucobacter albus]|uniref:Prevent-host-death family protein n=1 Tax=Leucobacter albus TaxID=272210 RepID=A0ABW3TTP7_9MICO